MELVKRPLLKYHGGKWLLAPLGNHRYFVCPDGIIPVEKLPEGFGLYYYKNGRFYLQKSSLNFRTNLNEENKLLVHAMRRFGSGDSTGILINAYGEGKNG
jgi:hypothetical protein